MAAVRGHGWRTMRESEIMNELVDEAAVCVVGAGAMGLSAAYQLARRGGQLAPLVGPPERRAPSR